MKTHNLLQLLICLTLFVFPAKAQQLPNPGFETWVNKGEYEQPTGWMSHDYDYDGLPFKTLTKDPDVKTGTYAAKLKVGGTTGGGDAGYMFLGNIDTLTGGYYGIPFAKNISQLTGWIKSNTLNGDSVSINVILTKWDNTQQQKKLLSTGRFTTGGIQNAYTGFTVALSQVASGVPDTLSIVIKVGIITGSASGTVGSYALFDDFATVDPVGMEEPLFNEDITFYPNPAADKMEIILPEKFSNSSVELTDIYGKSVLIIPSAGNSTSINTGNLARGNYMLRVMNDKFITVKPLILQ